jgi:hypothetical protein
MLPFAHFMLGFGAAYFFLKDNHKTLFNYLLFGLFSNIPDFDVIFKWLNIPIDHRTWSHGILSTFLFGIITFIYVRQFWLGAGIHLAHSLMDMIGTSGYAVVYIPKILTLPLIMFEKPETITFISAGVGFIIIFMIMLKEFKNRRIERGQNV